ncbi:MAG: hypothetical protein NUW01_01335 [Gemmatimonadaceae bacterium]|nr:hypothetical protein [Gemmatimonadaceae bacterium]
MANKNYGGLAGKGGGKAGGGKQGGSPMPTAMPERTAGWGGLPGPTGPDRSGGAPKEGHCGKFHVKQKGLA